MSGEDQESLRKKNKIHKYESTLRVIAGNNSLLNLRAPPKTAEILTHSESSNIIHSRPKTTIIAASGFMMRHRKENKSIGLNNDVGAQISSFRLRENDESNDFLLNGRIIYVYIIY